MTETTPNAPRCTECGSPRSRHFGRREFCAAEGFENQDGPTYRPMPSTPNAPTAAEVNVSDAIADLRRFVEWANASDSAFPKGTLISHDQAKQILEASRKAAGLLQRTASEYAKALGTIGDLRLDLEHSRAALLAARRDSERLDWLDKRKASLHGTWEGGEGFGCPASWTNPSVSWSISHTYKCPTYDMPRELAELSVRAAIDAAAATQEQR